jgi:hypothetical protein
MGVLLMVVMVLGYVVIWAIWHFFFREAGKDAPADASDVSRVARHSASSTEDDRRA